MQNLRPGSPGAGRSHEIGSEMLVRRLLAILTIQCPIILTKSLHDKEYFFSLFRICAFSPDILDPGDAPAAEDTPAPPNLRDAIDSCRVRGSGFRV
jgi:hypothetical protein